MSASTYLVRPTAVFRESYLEALREGFVLGLRPVLEEDEVAAIAADFEAHLARLDTDGQSLYDHNGHTSPTMPSNTFWLADGAEYIGSVNIRARIDTPGLVHFGGHIGYGIRPAMRRKGHGTRILALALEVCRGMGISLVRISCAEDNAGWRRIIEANGGVFLRRCEPAWYADHRYLLFEITLI